MVRFNITVQGVQASHSRYPFAQNEEVAMTPTSVPCVDSVICQEVTSLASCTLDELTQRLQTYSWAQVFEAVDRLSRQGTRRLTRTGRFVYTLSVGSTPSRLKLS